MNNLEGLKDYVDRNIETVKITEDIKNNIIKRSKKNTSNNLRYVAMIALPILLISSLIFHNQIGYATQRVLRYLPVINKLLYTDIEDKAYGLSGSIEMSIGEKYIKVNSAYSEGNTVTLIIEGDVPIMEGDTPIDYQITRIDEDKKVGELTSWDMIGDSDNGQWSGRFIYTFDDVINKFNIVYDKYRIPIIMTELPEVPSKDRNYISIEDINMDIAVVTNHVEDELEVNLLARTNHPTKSISFPLKDIYLLNDKGEKYYSIKNTLENRLYFNKKLEPGIKLVIPYISITDEGLQSKINISKDDEFPINIRIGDNDLAINNVDWIEYAKRFNYKTPENDYHPIEEAAQKIKMVINKNLNGKEELKLHDISAYVDKNQLNEYIVEDVNVIFDDPFEEKNSEITNDDYKELVISNIKLGQQEVNVTFSALIFNTTNRVIIPLQP